MGVANRGWCIVKWRIILIVCAWVSDCQNLAFKETKYIIVIGVSNRGGNRR